jgi:hypothetical protein
VIKLVSVDPGDPIARLESVSVSVEQYRAEALVKNNGFGLM